MRFTFPPCSESCRNWVQHHLESGNEVPAEFEGEQTFMSWKASSKNMPNFIFNVPTCFTAKSCHLKTLGSEFLAPMLSDMPEPDEGTKIRGTVKIERNQNRWN